MSDTDFTQPAILEWADTLDYLYELLEPPAWHAQAACKGLTPLFFNDRGSNADVAQAKQTCLSCPVQTECRGYALSTDNKEMGVWGGLSERERRVLRRRRRPLKPTRGPGGVDAACGTDSGYYRHIRQGTERCAACKKAHSDVTSRRQAKTSNAAQALRRRARVDAGWCHPCSRSEHSRCVANGCVCERCEAAA